MNHEAQALKLSDTRYSNPSGIVDAGNHSRPGTWPSSRGIVLRAPADRRLVSIQGRTRRPHGADYVNRNQLLWTYPDAVGMKTGFRPPWRGNSLAASPPATATR